PAALARVRHRRADRVRALGDRRPRRAVRARAPVVTIFTRNREPGSQAMATFAFRASVGRAAAVSPVAAPPPRRETLAIVSTSSRLCGIAAYTAAVRRQLDDIFDITVFDLN